MRYSQGGAGTAAASAQAGSVRVSTAASVASTRSHGGIASLRPYLGTEGEQACELLSYPTTFHHPRPDDIASLLASRAYLDLAGWRESPPPHRPSDAAPTPDVRSDFLSIWVTGFSVTARSPRVAGVSQNIWGSGCRVPIGCRWLACQSA